MAILQLLLTGTIWGFFLPTLVQCQLKCNFENDTCHWYWSNEWIRGQGKASNLDTGPTDDRTNPDGFYLHLNLTDYQRNAKAYIFSRPNLDVKKKYCLSFFYLMHGKQVATLSVHSVNFSSATEIWAKSFEHGPEWLYQEVSIENSSQVIFEAVFGGELGDIAIDDIEMTEGECLVEAGYGHPSPDAVLPFKCTFEKKSMCGFENFVFNFDDWEFGSGSNPTNENSPSIDHTLRTSKGTYLHFTMHKSFLDFGNSALASPKFKTTKGACVQFWYNMYGPGDYQMSVDIDFTERWLMKNSQGYGWKSAFIYVRGPKEFKITFNGESHGSQHAEMSIDDVTVQEGKCPQSVDCAFENTLCAWSNSGNDDTDWLTRTGKQPSRTLGPNADHTLGTEKGTYMILLSNPPLREGERARYVSTTIKETVKTQCFEFWYSMSGRNVGELHVSIYTQSSLTLGWKLVGPQTGQWEYASLYIDPRRKNFWIVIEGVIGKPSDAYIAIDDISLVEGTCKTSPRKAAIGSEKETTALPIKSTTLTTVNPSKLILSCHFNKDFCDWNQGKKDKGDWEWTHLATPSVLTGPQRDHTTGKGGFIFVEASDGIVGPIRLFSQRISPIHENMCLKFWYFMYGRDVDTLRVFISPGTHFDRDMNPHWKKSDSQAEKWFLGKIFFQMKQDFQIVFQASLNGKTFGDIALDDISLTYGACDAGEEITTPKPGVTEKPIPIGQRNCDFESKDICGYEHVKGTPKYFWLRNSGGTDTHLTGPTVDHTTNTVQGHYLYIEGTNVLPDSVARIITPLYQDATSVCLQFYYHMYGTGIGKLNLKLLPGGKNNNTQTIYSASGNRGNKWRVDRVTIDKLTAMGGYKIMFEAKRGTNYRADIALDDISFSAGKCASLGDCNFEHGSCAWKNVRNDDFDWVMRSGKTPTPGTGPESDHTLGNNKGHYMYIETSPPIKPGMKAKFISPLLPKIDNNMCMEFWYSMFGKTVDSLKVILQVTGFPKTVLWHLKGTQGKNWLYARVPLTGTATTYTLFFEASSGAKYTGDIAIDDISFTENECQILPHNAKVTTTASPHLTTTAPTTPSLLPRNISCNFDKDLCGWKQDKQDGNQWYRKSGPDSTKDSGPPGDHTGKGHYILLDTSSNKTGSKARLISPDYTPEDTGVNCISFWYFMYGADVDSLNVYLQYGLMLPTLPTWTAKGSKEEKWLQGKFPFHSTRVLNIVFEAVAGSSIQGDIAVDDISISSGKCVDQNDDIYKCDFETKDMCGFLKHKIDYWTWHSGITPNKGLGPVRDHTLGSREGHYIFLEGLSSDRTSITSTPIIHTNSTSCVQFYYMLRGRYGLLTVYLNDYYKLIRVWNRRAHQINSWQLASIEVKAKSYSIQFGGKVNKERYGNIAIDDFSILKGKCPPKGQCDFEHGTCIWQNSQNDDFDWIIKRADDSPSSVNPRIDHTSNKPGAGHFLYVSADDHRPHSRALIDTQDLEPLSVNCLRFWFNSYGKDPGTITIRLKTKRLSLTLWTLSFNNAGKLLKNGHWHLGRIRIPRTSHSFTIRIDVDVRTSGYIAIDDIVLDKASSCMRNPPFHQPIITKPPTTIPPTTTKKIDFSGCCPHLYCYIHSISVVCSPAISGPSCQTQEPSRCNQQPSWNFEPNPLFNPLVTPSVTCLFTYDFCGWTQDKTDEIDWIRHKGPTATNATGPPRDHTTRTGYYIYIESSPPTKPGDVARIITPEITLKKNQKKCMTFWYYMYGETIGTLSLLFLVNGTMSAPIWKRHKFQGNTWIKGAVNLEGVQSLKVVFAANSGNGYSGDIALDDVRLEDNFCRSIDDTPLPSCDFEGPCNYKTVSRGSVIPWIITTPSNHPNITDHTYNTLSGEFMYVNMSESNQHKLARIMTPTIKAGQYCLEFFYQSIDGFNGYFTIHTVRHYVKTSVFFQSGSHIKNQWTIVEVNLKESTDFTVMFEVLSHQKTQGMIAVDDIVFKNGVCPSPGSCDFERGRLCFWTNDPANDVDWIVQNGRTSTPGTGPLSDHTKKTKAGMYALLESSFPAKIGNRVRLISQPLNNNNVQSCFHFWYNMRGSTVGSLSVSVKSSKNVVIKYWQLSGHQGHDWHQGQIPIAPLKEDYQIIIEATVGGSFGDVGIDDIYINENVCNFHPRLAKLYFPTTVPPVVITTTNPPIISGDRTFNCTFENGTCGWTQSSTDDFNWIRNQGYTPSRETGPQGDHTTGRGHYMYLEGDGGRHYQKAELMYLEDNVNPGLKCMKFWYSMRGSNVGTLNIYVITEVREQSAMWTKSGTQGPAWNLAKVEFNCTATYKVLIEGVKHHRFVGDIAIDDISLQDGGCKELYGDCDFETNDICGYQHDKTADFVWKLIKGETSSKFTGPKADHTYGTNSGHYMYIESSRPQKPNETARLISPVYKAFPDEHCLLFYYNMYGENVGELNVKIRIHSSDNTTYDTDNYLQIVGEQGPNWKQAQMELPRLITENPYQLIFEGVIGKGYLGDIAIDDIVINTKPCEIGGDCDFEFSRCTWVNVHHEDDFDWVVGSGATSTAETGPLTDHTLEKAAGFYLYIDASDAQLPGQKAWYASQDFPPTYGQSRCLTFWYSMNGVGVGTLRVVIIFENNRNNTLWELNRDQGNDWQFGQAPIKSPTHYKIIFEAVRGPDDKGDIAIDDIIFTDFSCSVQPDIATARDGKQTLPTITGTTPTPHLSQGLNCTFDLGACGWTQDTTDDVNWLENKGETPESGTGPKHDHSPSGRGVYFYFDTRSHHPYKKARLVSPLMRSNGLQCFTVWYHMYGSDIGSFRVYVFTGPKLSSPEFRRYSTQGDKWLRADIQFNTESPYNIILEARSATGAKGNIAVDDVSLVDGYCDTQAVGGELLCTFEKGMCGFIQDKEDDFDWVDSVYLHHSILSDHTYGTKSGHFLYASSSTLRTPEQFASVNTPVLSFNSTDVCVEFWYHMSGVGVGTLKVAYLSNKDNFKSPISLWSREEPKGYRWLQGLIDIDLKKNNITEIQIKFYGIIGAEYWTIIGLDDITISSRVCKRNRGDCNFENGMCNWANVHRDDFDWTIGSGFTTTTKTGPLKDHTRALQGGSYLYIEPESTNSKTFANLQSEIFDHSQEQCFQFYYFMKGATDGSLEVLVQPEGHRAMTSIWHLEGHQSGNWTLAQMHLPPMATTYRVIIRGFRGPRFEGQIAIDDIQFSKTSPCKTLPPKAKIIVTTPAPVTPTPAPIAGFDCTFDRDLCGWHHHESNLLWTRRSGKNTKPGSDHTGGGFFIAIDSSNLIFNNHATIGSPEFPLNKQRCLSFYYYMSGEDRNTLSIGMRSVFGLETIWKRIGPQGDDWIHVTIGLPVISSKASIEVKGTGPLLGHSGVMALDDISLYPGKCQEPKNRTVIDCDFEDSQICGYTQDHKDNFDWSYGSGSTLTKKEGPRADHTFGTSFGHYMYLNSTKRRAGERAALWTPRFTRKDGLCLTFWYRMSGQDIGSLEILFTPVKSIRYSPIVWMRRGHQNDNWIREYVPIRIHYSLYVVFQGVAGVKPGSIAIDDVKLLPSCYEPGDCTFEIDSCGWLNDRHNDINWQRVRLGHINFNKMSPPFDHTNNGRSGHIMYFSSRYRINSGKKGDLISMSFDPTSAQGLCFEFWFMIKGHDFGSLTVFKLTNSTERVMMWQLSESKSKSWAQGTFQVTSSLPYQIVFRALKGDGSDGYIAIDDIAYTAVVCAVTPIEAEPPMVSTVPPTTLPMTTHQTIMLSPFDCTFEYGFCKWTQAKDDFFDWTIGMGTTDTANTGPKMDHTLGTRTGHFAFIEASYPQKPSDKARLVSPVMNNIGKMCLTFWYHMYGEHIRTLNVYIYHGKGNKTIIWSRTGTLDRKWYEGNVNFYAVSTTQIIFEGVRGESYKGDIALDDIKIVNGSCPENINNCNFENADMCNYKQSGSDDFDWSVGNSYSSRILPSTDHTYRTRTGKFIYTLGKQRPSTKAQIFSTVMPSTLGTCVHFWYSLAGAIQLNVYSLAGGKLKLVRTFKSEARNWQAASVDITSESTWEVMFEAKVMYYSLGSYIAIDDIELKKQKCGMTGDCTFQLGMCDWKNQGYDDFDWIIKRADTGNMGPIFDHTLQISAGSYLFIDGSSPQKAGDKAILKHVYISIDHQRSCLRFWYSTHGNTELEISLEKVAVLWRIKGGYSQRSRYEWKHARIPLPNVKTFGTLIIKGTIGYGSSSYVAVDDISFHVESCDLRPVEARPKITDPQTTQSPVTVTPSFVPHSIYDCAFEHGLCSWNQSSSDDFDWKRWQGATTTVWTGPDFDHTTGTDVGWYVYIEASKPRVEGDRAILVSHPFKSNTVYCFMFYYFMYGTSLGKLNVILTNEDGSNVTIWTKSRAHGKNWKNEAFRIPSQNNTFTLSFEGIIGSGNYGDIAIDDLRAVEGECPEAGPLNCTFESAHICGYTAPAENGSKWKKRTESKSSRLGPTTDHTVNTFDGSYMYLEWDSKDQKVAQAQLISPLINASTDFCMSFFYRKYQHTIGELNVYQQIGNTKDAPLRIQLKYSEHGWVKMQVTLLARESYKVVFEGIVRNYQGSVEIDDISTEPGLCPEPGNCDFEKGLCTWMNAVNTKADWKYGKGDTPSTDTGPSVDHTTFKPSGHYMFLEASYIPRGMIAQLQSMAFPSTNARCLHFWYHMHGREMGGLKIYFVDEMTGNKTAIWYLTGDQGNKWQYAQVAFAHTDINYVIIEGIKGTGYRSDIAIDDIVFIMDYCATMPHSAQTNYVFPKVVTTVAPSTSAPNRLDCNFETECSWKHGETDDFKWKIHKGITPTFDTGPQFDHSLGTAEGHYIYIETSFPRPTHAKAHYVSPSFVPTQNGCLQFWYFMYGADVDTLTVYQKTGHKLTPIWIKSGNTDALWHLGLVPVRSDNNTQIIFEGIGGEQGRWLGDIALDDISFSFNGCPNSFDINCGFEETEICGFTKSKGDFDWRWYSPGNLHIRRQNDHTLGTAQGHYMVAWGEKRKYGDKAIIAVSQNYTSDTSKCVEFWYYMSGGNPGSLNVYATVGESRLKVWSRSGNQGDAWSLGKATVRKSGAFKLEFEAVIDEQTAFIAIDDFATYHGDCPKPGNCDFEKGWCTWNNIHTDDFDWQIGTGYLGIYGSPRQDHTTDSVSGHFIFLEASFPIHEGGKAALVSQLFEGTFRKCMQFWYFIRETSTATLNVYIVTAEAKNLSWTLSGSHEQNTWFYARFSIPHEQQDFKILIEGINGAGNRIDIAIDDISFTDELCNLFPDFATTVKPTATPTAIPTTTNQITTPVPTPFDCTFEKGWCLWIQDTNDTSDWVRSQGPMGNNVTGLMKDHTSGTDDGWYIFADLSATAKSDGEARLLGPHIEASKDRCLNFWYHMYGAYIGTLYVRLTAKGHDTTVFEKRGDQRDAWVESFINLPANPNNLKYQVIFGSKGSTHTNQQIALDDIRFTEGACHENNLNFCDFEDGAFCNYKQLPTDDFDWTWTSGRTPTLLTGPNSDHTTGSKYGHYMFIESSYMKPNKKAQIMSPKYNTTETKCLHFYYYMYGDHVGELNVYTVDGMHFSEIGTPIWSRKYNQGPKWIEGQASIFPDNDYHIVFEGVTGNGKLSDIAIDDISLTNGPCQRPGFCDFEKDLCTWTNIERDQFDWIRGKGNTDSPDTGPTSDHTLGTPDGYYIYIEASLPQTPGDVARLQSEDFLPSNLSMCLRFWYQMNGEDVNALNVLVQNANEKGEGYLWSQKGDNGPQWLSAQLSVDKIYTNKPYHLLFEGIRGKGHSGDIAIDDVDVSIGECEIVPKYADPKQIALENVACSFDGNTFCEWELSRRNDLYWELAKGKSRTYRSGPEADHSGSGYYIFMKNHRMVFHKGYKAVASTPTLGPTTGKGNCFTFYYHMYGSDIGTLNIYTIINREKILRWSKSGDQGNKWIHAHFNINSKINYKISIEGVTSGGYSEVIALDDLGMDANPCPPARECDFSLDLCGWTAQENYQEWLHAVGPTPIEDHSTGTRTGGILYTNSTAEKKATVVSRVVTPSYPPASESCLKFWYYIDGIDPGELHVYVRQSHTDKRVWERKQLQGDIWWLAHVNVGQSTLPLTQPYKFVFESVQESGPRSNGIIAIDDVEHLPGPCSSNGVCDFEQDLCGFNNLKGDDLDWIRAKASTARFYGPPSGDHTLKTSKGHYVYVNDRLYRKKKKAWLASWVQEKTAGKCVKFWYAMNGIGLGKLNVLLWGPDGRKVIWTRIGHNGDVWLSAAVTIISKDPFSVVFEVEKSPEDSGAIALDDILFMDGSCESQTTPSIGLITQPPTPDSMLRCNFDLSLCGWKQDTTDSTNWILTTGANRTGGPLMDHTDDNDKGGYIMIKSSTVIANHTARLMSDVIYQEEPVCLTFWYHMRGRNPGTLNVYIKNMGEKKGPVWTKSGDQGSTWRYAEIEIANPEKGNKIYFEGIRPLGYGDISLDDVALLLDNCPPRDFCDFEESDICGYEQGDTDVFDWTWGRGQTTTYHTGPKYDHTYKTIFGHYMFIEVSSGSKDDHAYLYSPVYPATTDERCLTFWYNMYGEDVARLNVYLYQNNQFGDLIWSLQMNQGPNWHLATVPVNSQSPFQVVFDGIRGKGVMGDIAIDDVKLSKEACDPVAFCTFEENICGWENLYDTARADTAWQRVKASSMKRQHGPAVDHTIGKKSGYYVQMDTGIHKWHAARLKSQTIPLLPNNPKSYCFHFWYNVYGVKTGQLNVYIYYHGDVPQNVWSEISGNKTDESKWRHGMVLIEDPYSHFEVVLEGISSDVKNTYIALDDLQLLPGICPNMTESKYTCTSGKTISASKVCDFLHDCPDFDDEENCGDCTFENDMCTWSDVNGAAFNWTRNQGRVNNQDAEITIDHTQGSEKGWYVFANAYNAKYNDKALLRNRALQQTSATCQINFWYYLSGHSIGHLALNALEGGTITNLWKVSYDHGNRWNQYTADIGKISRPFKLQFLAFGTYSDNGVMAIDDIEFRDCSFPDPKENCSSTEFQCKHMGCVDISRVCDLSDDCGDGSDEIGCQNFTSCDFENSLCKWSQDKSDNFDWKRQSVETDTYWTGPSRDHSKGTASGYYIYAEGSQPQKKGDRARLISPLIEPPGNKECWIRFFYHMRGYKIGALNLYTRTTRLGPYNKVWSKQGHIGDVWERADVKLFSVTYFEALFEAVVAGDGDIALDDITLTPGCVLADSSVKMLNGTKVEPTPSPCGAGLFQCKNSQCILQSQVCNFNKDCKDGSDEEVCGTCDFETLNICGWKIRSTGRFTWQSHQGKSPAKFGPPKDHTTNSDTGKYMMVLGAYGVYKSFAYLETRPFSATEATCEVEFYVYMEGPGVGEISLNVINPVTYELKKKVTRVIGNQGANWKRMVGHIGAQPAGFALQFMALPNAPKHAFAMKTDMAIDDVKLLNCGPKPVSTGTPTPTGITKPGTPTPTGISKPGTPTPSGITKPGTPTPSGVTKPGTPTPSGITKPGTPTPSGITKPVTPTPTGISKPGKPTQTPSRISTLGTPTPTPKGISTPGTPTPKGISTPGTPTPKGISTPATPTPKRISTPGTPTATPKGISKPATPTPKGGKVCANGSFSCPTAKHLCFPLAFRCDGHSDCPDSYDEEHCGICPSDQTYCIPKQQCISLRRCDGIADCPDGSDESACKECLDDFCLNGGTCKMINGSSKCQCKEKDVNFRCAVIMSLPQKSKEKSEWKITLGIFLSSIFVAIIVSILYILWSRRHRQFTPERIDEHDGVHNPAYDYGLNLPAELNLTDDLEPPNFNENAWNVEEEHSFANPLYKK